MVVNTAVYINKRTDRCSAYSGTVTLLVLKLTVSSLIPSSLPRKVCVQFY